MKECKNCTYMVPPALVEIGEPVTERDLDEFEGAADNPRDFRVSNDHHLEPPTGQVSYEMHIEHGFVDITHAWNWMFWGENAAIFCIISFGQLIAQTWMENFEHFSSFIEWQQKNERHENWVCEEHTKESTPEYGMWSSNIWVWELCDTKCHQGQKAEENRPSVVFKDVRIVFVFEIVTPFSFYLVDHGVPQVIEGQEHNRYEADCPRIMEYMAILVLLKLVMK